MKRKALHTAPILGLLTLGLLGFVAVTAQSSTWTGTISIFAQGLTPTQKNNLKAMREVADQYQSQHPGIKIQFEPSDYFPEYGQVVRAKAAAGELWDVFWAQWTDLNGDFPTGIAVDLKPYFAQKNPYIPSSPTWGAAMNQTVLGMSTAPNGAIYNINGDWVTTNFYYNKDLFAKAGIKSAPTSWVTLLSTSKKLKAAGIPAGLGVPIYSWWQRHFLTDFYTKDYKTLSGYDKKPGMSALDEAVAAKKGILSPKDARFMSWWPKFKELTDTWVPDDFTAGPFSVKETEPFIAGKSAIYYSGSWVSNDLVKAKLNFSSFNFPRLSKRDFEFATGRDVAGQVGGPNAGFQFAISTPKANKTLAEAGKAEAVLDFLRFLGSPKNVEKVVNEQGSFVPTWPNTTPKPGLESLNKQTKALLEPVTMDNFGPKIGGDMQRIFGAYLSNNITLEEATKQVQAAIDASVDAYEKTNKVDLSKY